ncbi:hypothetical protein [Haloarcula nitratireducens]|uniref:Uncharacterized protein n=1 Tax=Haloarcula nitratireducens TaxID=2487749 RepID=A0AAW4PHE6_9EURY|nr:hypothetical protein [Halomicroarcula nitratireducens]MBX0297003.1 hypothetical protein [Halomicroarcula nitratireducens]
MARTDPTAATGGDSAPAQRPQWRLRYQVGDLVHYTEWHEDFATVENLAVQYRHGDYGHDVVIERRTAVEG